ncbi:MAG: DNA (cytosine-5-)-methyltransferase [Desulfovibrio sp. S3730MH75]|nr:MAG: DNA (cytosine-5-)-methyltransferase [Desulfovibrio sp. S3730MH75]
MSSLIPQPRKFTAVDLFSGAGGFTLAAQNCGLSVLAAVESQHYACLTYENNFIKNKQNPPLLFQEDIRSLKPESIVENLGLNAGELDILLGGPPCQGFSSHRINNAGVDDPRNELLLQYFRFVESFQPKAFIVENVPGMLWERHEEFVENFYELATNADYHVFDPIILNAKDYGIPQNRRRVFILGLSEPATDALQWPPEQTHFAPNSREVLEQDQPSWVTAGVVFNDPLKKGDPNDLHMNHTKELIKVFRSTPPNGGSRTESNRVLPCHQNGYKGHKDVYGRINPDQVGPTMTTGCFNPSKGRFLHPTEHHGITIRHAARFQAFPDEFIFHGGITAEGAQVGNAVPIRLGEQVIGVVEDYLRILEEQCDT